MQIYIITVFETNDNNCSSPNTESLSQRKVKALFLPTEGKHGEMYEMEGLMYELDSGALIQTDQRLLPGRR